MTDSEKLSRKQAIMKEMQDISNNRLSDKALIQSINYYMKNLSEQDAFEANRIVKKFQSSGLLMAKDRTILLEMYREVLGRLLHEGMSEVQ